MTRYRILGSLSVAGADVTAGRERVVLAMLLLHSERVVGAAELIDALWGDDPPSTARGQLQTCVSRLRRALPPGAIATDPAGYRLHCAPDEVDAAVFVRLVTRGRERADPVPFRQALGLWRGPALAGIDSPAVRRAAAVWDERRMAVTEEWVDLELGAGREPELLGELAALVERFPLRERLRGQLMTALWRSGRQADALAEYRRARAALRDELGLDPGRELQELHQRILAGQPPAGALVARSSRVRCLPRTVGDFTGRDAVVSRLAAALDGAGPLGPAIVVIDGMPGSGKTTLALHVAALVGERFPDAHLYVDLHGHSTEQPLEPDAALVLLLRQLGVPADDIPPSPVDRVGRWRTELAGRRALVLLDNAASSAQLADLLPTSAGTVALVTSRRRLAGLDGGYPESLGVLPEEEAVALLARIAGDRVPAEPEAAAEVARRCGGLPLALRLAGARLAHRSRWRVADLAGQLRVAALPGLAAEGRSVAGAFALSYGHLAEPVRDLFRLLGLNPGADFDALGAAALAGRPLDDVRDMLDHLVDVHLVDEPQRGVYRMHDLLREFAAALAAELPAERRRAALVGVLDLQLHAAVALSPEKYREMAYRDLGNPQPLRPDLLAEVTDPVERFERERPHLAAVVAAAATAGRPEYAWWIPRAAWRHMFYWGHDQELVALFEQAMTIVQANGNRTDLAVVANYLASGCIRQGDPVRALELLRLSARTWAELGRPRATVTPLGNLAGVYEFMGRFAESIATARESRRVAALTGERTRGRCALAFLALGSFRLGRYAEALRYSRLHLMAAIDNRDESGILNWLLRIQVIRWVQGSLPPAAARRTVEVLLRRARRIHLEPIARDAHSELGRLWTAEGRFAEAMAAHRAALAVPRQNDDSWRVASYLIEFAHTCRAAGDTGQARELYGQALELTRAARMGFEAARAEAGIAECLAEVDPEQARRSWLAALRAFRDMGVPERFEVERRLAAVAGSAA